jgi:predicted transcriptional regulator
MSMERTQIYLPHALKKQLQAIAMEDGENVSEILRRAAEDYTKRRLKNKKKSDAVFLEALHGMAGVWADRDPEEFREIRRSWDRTFPR